MQDASCPKVLQEATSKWSFGICFKRYVSGHSTATIATFTVKPIFAHLYEECWQKKVWSHLGLPRWEVIESEIDVALSHRLFYG